MSSTLPVSEIDIDDGYYRITADTEIDTLALSIREIGLINPPLVRKMGQGFRIVSGFRRIGALISNGESFVQTRVVSENKDTDLSCALSAVAENAFQRELTTLEQARGVRLLANYLDIRSIAAQSQGIFKIQMNAAHVERLLSLVSLPLEIQSLLASDRLSMTAALKLHGKDFQTLSAFGRLFSSIRVGLNKQVEIITHIHEIASREGSTSIVVLLSPPVLSILTDDKTDESRKGNLLRAYLVQRRYPEISRRHAEFSARVKTLGLGPGIRIEPPVNFEAMAYSLILQFTSYENLKAQLNTVQSLGDNPDMEQLFQ
ncbi:MAG: ParB N-terminal domain-containing protein [Pseudomonadota bacterium]